MGRVLIRWRRVRALPSYPGSPTQADGAKTQLYTVAAPPTPQLPRYDIDYKADERKYTEEPGSFYPAGPEPVNTMMPMPEHDAWPAKLRWPAAAASDAAGAVPNVPAAAPDVSAAATAISSAVAHDAPSAATAAHANLPAVARASASDVVPAPTVAGKPNLPARPDDAHAVQPSQPKQLARQAEWRAGLEHEPFRVLRRWNVYVHLLSVSQIFLSAWAPIERKMVAVKGSPKSSFMPS